MAGDTFARWRTTAFRTGAIAPLRLGATQDEVLESFGPPDDESVERRKGRPVILKYENVEFHFDGSATARLALVYCEDESGEIRLCVPPANAE